MNKESKFKKGDVVILKIGSPKMIISEINGEIIKTKWFDKKSAEFKFDEFVETSLKKSNKKINFKIIKNNY